MLRRVLPMILATALPAAWMIAAAVKAPTTRPAPKPPAAKKPASNLDMWFKDAPAKADKKTAPLSTGVNPFQRKRTFRREDALPGVAEFSDGRQLPGGLYTTREKDWEVFVEKEKRWRRVPFIVCLSINAVVTEAKMEQQWRWKAMGEPERVYTGKEYPYRRFLWKLHLIDGTYITGALKGQPLWIERLSDGGRDGPFLLHERDKGKEGTKLKDHVYLKRVIVSRRMMEKVLQHQAEQKKKAKEAGRDKPAGARKKASPDR